MGDQISYFDRPGPERWLFTDQDQGSFDVSHGLPDSVHHEEPGVPSQREPTLFDDALKAHCDEQAGLLQEAQGLPKRIAELGATIGDLLVHAGKEAATTHHDPHELAESVLSITILREDSSSDGAWPADATEGTPSDKPEVPIEEIELCERGLIAMLGLVDKDNIVGPQPTGSPGRTRSGVNSVCAALGIESRSRSWRIIKEKLEGVGIMLVRERPGSYGSIPSEEIVLYLDILEKAEDPFISVEVITAKEKRLSELAGSGRPSMGAAVAKLGGFDEAQTGEPAGRATFNAPARALSTPAEAKSGPQPGPEFGEDKDTAAPLVGSEQTKADDSAGPTPDTQRGAGATAHKQTKRGATTIAARRRAREAAAVELTEEGSEDEVVALGDEFSAEDREFLSVPDRFILAMSSPAVAREGYNTAAERSRAILKQAGIESNETTREKRLSKLNGIYERLKKREDAPHYRYYQDGRGKYRARLEPNGERHLRTQLELARSLLAEESEAE